MFGMGFTEILIIAVIAILFLGPDKLPSTMIEIAKFFRNAKSAIGNVKDTIEEEMHVADIKSEALQYKAQLEEASSQLHKVTDIKSTVSSEIDSILNDEDDAPKKPTSPYAEEQVTFKKKKKKEPAEEKSDVKIEEEIKDV